MMEPASQGTVLIADDEPFVLDSMTQLLTQYGYSVIACNNAGEAFEKFNQDDIDVVITDIKMPKISGIELLDNITNVNPDMPVILMTAFADITTTVDAIKKRAFDFIIKPFKVDQLLYSVEKAMKYNRLFKLEKDYKNMLEEFNRDLEAMVSERTMSLMALTVADRVRNPAAIIGQISRRILEKEAPSQGVRASVENIVEEAGKLETIVSEFQDIFQKRQSYFIYDDINPVVRKSISIAQKEADGKGIELTAVLTSQPLKINMQRNLLSIAVSQLVRNAVEATSKGGSVVASTLCEADRVVLTVSDTGQGIAAENIDKIFNPFFSTREKRFGMGLAVVKQIIKEHLGEITVESCPGKGTTFRLLFPVRWLEKSLHCN